jgi:hypothetical protein
MLKKLARLEHAGDGRARATILAIADALTVGIRGRPKLPKGGNRPKRERTRRAEAQRGYSYRHYMARFQAIYREYVQKLIKQGRDTPENRRELKDIIIAKETTPHTGPIKKQALEDFSKWAEANIASVTTMINNSR